MAGCLGYVQKTVTRFDELYWFDGYCIDQSPSLVQGTGSCCEGLVSRIYRGIMVNHFPPRFENEPSLPFFSCFHHEN